MDNERFLEPRGQIPVRDVGGQDLGSMVDLQLAGLVVVSLPYQNLREIREYKGSESQQEPIYKHL